MKKQALASTTLLLATLAGTAFGAVVKQDGAKLVGSDTLDGLMADVYPKLGLIIDGGTLELEHQGLGSSVGQRQVEGKPKAADGEPSCSGSGAAQFGCQGIAPMSRPLNKCAAGNTTAEGLKVCKDAIVVITDNKSHMQTQAGACAAVPADTDNTDPVYTQILTNSGDLGADWKSDLNLIYTGCPTGDASCAALPRTQRCASAARVAKLDSWNNLFTGSACSSGSNCTGVRQVYRRDDGSGTTGVFLELIGSQVTSVAGRNLTTPFVSGVTAVPETHAFCDGGAFEGVQYNPNGTPAGDPIRKPCAAEDDICGADGKIGVVRAIRSTPDADIINPAITFPKKQCTFGSFARVAHINATAPVGGIAPTCPDGTTGSTCLFPYYADGANKVFNCISSARNKPASQGSTFDGRVYNSYMHDDTAGGKTILASNVQVNVAQWRQNMVKIQGSVFVPNPPNGDLLGFEVCQETSATRNIGCITASTTCTMGFAGREAATDPDSSAGQEAFLLAGLNADTIQNVGYGLARDLYINTLVGFENVYASCLASGLSDSVLGASWDVPGYCLAQAKVAAAFAKHYEQAADYCSLSGFDPIPKIGGVDIRCEGTADALAGCGATNPLTTGGIKHQSIASCDPCATIADATAKAACQALPAAL